MLEQFSLMAEYNKLMNERQYDAASKLTDPDIREDRGAFFKSVLGSLNHIMVGDIVWLKRFAKVSPSRETLAYVQALNNPDSLDSIIFTDLVELREARSKIDNEIIAWINGLADSELGKCISYTNMVGKQYKKPFASLLNHLFLHQVHHRGQVTTLLSQYGVDFGETDLVEIIQDCIV